MAKRKKRESGAFYTDGMTVQQILELGDDVLSTLSGRDLSHALRTVSLAANKRIDRLLDNAVLRHGEYIPKKSAKKKIATDALNSLYEMQGKPTKSGMKFSGKGLTRDQQYAEFARARYFMNLKTSTVSGAKSVRQDRERRIFDKTSEDYIKKSREEFIKEFKDQFGKKPTQKEIDKELRQKGNEFEELNKQAWSNYRKFLENNDIIGKYYGSDEVIAFIGQRTAEAAAGGTPYDEEEVFAGANKIKADKYKEKQDEEHEKHMAFLRQFVDRDFDMGADF